MSLVRAVVVRRLLIGGAENAAYFSYAHWEISSQIVRQMGCPVFLAGGLGPDNVAEAIDRVRPFGVDVCSRLRPNGYLDEDLLAQFFVAARSASAG